MQEKQIGWLAGGKQRMTGRVPLMGRVLLGAILGIGCREEVVGVIHMQPPLEPGRYSEFPAAAVRTPWGRILVSSAGDFDGDGLGDILVANKESHSLKGSVRVVSGLDHREIFRFIGSAEGEMLGAVATGCGDLNQDGFDDIAFRSKDGVSLAFGGPVDGQHDLEKLPAGFGAGVFFLGPASDLDGDGYDDLMLGRKDRAGIEVTVYSLAKGISIFGVRRKLSALERDVALAAFPLVDQDGDCVPDVLVATMPKGRIPGPEERGRSAAASPYFVEVLSGASSEEIAIFGPLNRAQPIFVTAPVGPPGTPGVGFTVGCTDALRYYGLDLSKPVELGEGPGRWFDRAASPSGVVLYAAAPGAPGGIESLGMKESPAGPNSPFGAGSRFTVWDRQGQRTHEFHVSQLDAGSASISCIGDSNGDGAVDWAIAIPARGRSSHIYVVFGERTAGEDAHVPGM